MQNDTKSLSFAVRRCTGVCYTLPTTLIRRQSRVGVQPAELVLKNVAEKQQMASTLPRLGCCIWLRRLCQWHVLHVLYIAIRHRRMSRHRPYWAVCRSRVKPDRRSRLSYRRVKRFFLHEAICGPIKKISISGSTTENHTRTLPKCLKESLSCAMFLKPPVAFERLVCHNRYASNQRRFYSDNRREMDYSGLAKTLSVQQKRFKSENWANNIIG